MSGALRNARTLVVDVNDKPFAVVSVQDVITDIAMQMIGDDRYPIEVLVSDPDSVWHSKELTIPTPLIVRTLTYNHVSLETDAHRAPKRRVLFYRDNFTCQYCGVVAPKNRGGMLTVDHVKPACLFESRLAATTWDNITTACRKCNHEKGMILPEVYGHPATKPCVPHITQINFAGRLNLHQQKFVRDHYNIEAGAVAL